MSPASDVALAVVSTARRRPARRTQIVTGGLTAALLAVFAARVLLGDFTFTIPDFFRILFGAEVPGASFILMESKLPRAVLGVLVGSAFGVAGAIKPKPHAPAIGGNGSPSANPWAPC